MTDPSGRTGVRIDSLGEVCLWACPRCGHREFSRERPPGCWCGGALSLAVARDGAVRPARTLADIPEPTWTRVPTSIPELDELTGGGLVTPSTVLVWGSRGSGKTTLAFRAARSLRTLLVPLEMSAELYRHTAARAGAELRRIRIGPSDVNPALWLRCYRHEQCECLVIDSLGKTPEPVRIFERLGRACREGRVGLVLAIAHATRDGEARGGPALEHEADVCLVLEPGRFELAKNRFGATGRVRAEWPPP